jgi:hypothetical protein
MTKHSFALVLIPLAMSLAFLFPFPVTSADKAPDQTKSITVADLRELQVIGWLGHPLGKIVTIEGIVADDYYRKYKADAGQTLLRVLTVNGQKLPEEKVFHFFAHYFARVDEPKVGSNFKYSGYETGSFTGTPQMNVEYLPAFCTTGYGFTTEFVILRDELK